jgi:hypothetical protein
MALAEVGYCGSGFACRQGRCALPAGPHFLLGRQKKVSKEKAMTLFAGISARLNPAGLRGSSASVAAGKTLENISRLCRTA